MISTSEFLNCLNTMNLRQPEDCPVKAGEHYSHYKEGTMYTVVCIALDSETQEQYVVYQGWLSGKVWIRSVKEFTAIIPLVGKRFSLIEKKEPLKITSWEHFKEVFGIKDDGKL